MRIARVLTRLNLGGPARQVLASDPLLVARGHQLRVFAGTPEPGEGDLFDLLAARGVDVVRVPGLGRGWSLAGDLRALAAAWKGRRGLRPGWRELLACDEVVCVSQHGDRGVQAARLLRERGLFNATAMDGGIDAWVALGGALEDRS